MEKKKMPIGYYLRKTDNLLTERINEIHAAVGLSRIEWQILNSISHGLDKNAIITQLSEFESTEQLNKLIRKLIEGHLITDNIEPNLTSKGEAVFNDCLQRQTELRLKSMQNISEQEYTQLISTLEKIIDNLE